MESSFRVEHYFADDRYGTDGWSWLVSYIRVLYTDIYIYIYIYIDVLYPEAEEIPASISRAFIFTEAQPR